MKERKLFNFDEFIREAYQQTMPRQVPNSQWDSMRSELINKGLIKKKSYRIGWIAAMIVFSSIMGLGAIIYLNKDISFIIRSDKDLSIETTHLQNLNSKTVSSEERAYQNNNLVATTSLGLLNELKNNKLVSVALNKADAVELEINSSNVSSNNQPTDSEISTPMESLKLLNNKGFPSSAINLEIENKNIVGLEEPKRKVLTNQRYYIGMGYEWTDSWYQLRALTDNGKRLLDGHSNELLGEKHPTFGVMGIGGVFLNPSLALELTIGYSQKQSVNTGYGYINASDSSQDKSGYRFSFEGQYLESQMKIKYFLNKGTFRFFIAPGAGINMNYGQSDKNYFEYRKNTRDKILFDRVILSKYSIGVDLIANTGVQWNITDQWSFTAEAGYQHSMNEVIRRSNYSELPIGHRLKEIQVFGGFVYRFKRF